VFRLSYTCNNFQPYSRISDSGGWACRNIWISIKCRRPIAVEEWITAIKQEEELASVNHTIAEVDKWEGANFREDELRSKVKAAKKRYEDALREKFFGF
jgi:hypothetical protein